MPPAPSPIPRFLLRRTPLGLARQLAGPFFVPVVVDNISLTALIVFDVGRGEIELTYVSFGHQIFRRACTRQAKRNAARDA